MAFTSVVDVLQNSNQTISIFKASQGYGSGGRFFSQWGISGSPPAGAVANTINGEVLTSPVTGSLEYPAAPAGKDSYIAGIQYNCTSPGIITVADRIWHNGGIAIGNTDLQLITTPTWPARDQNASANGVGVIVAIELISSAGAGTPTFTLSYTNSNGVSGRTATTITPTATTPSIGSMFIFGLDEGDIGVRSIQSIQQTSSWASGEYCLVAFKPLMMVDLPGTSNPIRLDPLTLGVPKIIPGSVLYTIFTPNNSTTVTLVGGITIAYG